MINHLLLKFHFDNPFISILKHKTKKEEKEKNLMKFICLIASHPLYPHLISSFSFFSITSACLPSFCLHHLWLSLFPFLLPVSTLTITWFLILSTYGPIPKFPFQDWLKVAAFVWWKWRHNTKNLLIDDEKRSFHGFGELLYL